MVFHLGTEIPSDKPFNFEAKDLTTHGVIVGMTGSGKTGLGIVLLEEAAKSKLPVIAIDPKGDIANLKSQEDEISIYTPANQAGIPLSILSSFKPPAGADRRDVLISTTSSLLGLLGIDADPINSKEHILISKIIEDDWNKGYEIDLPMLIDQIQNPPFKKVGALDTEAFFPAKERNAFSVKLNNLLASPSFQSWMEGERLNIDKLLYTSDGKPKISILYIAHLGDAERMFFVTLLLNEMVNWLRRQEGTPNLRALLYMDEIFGYFPPNRMPPSKTPMLLLLKQARAFGVGIVLATQNPVDLDYKGLSNCGTWFIGKLLTDRDKSKVLEGLELGKERKQLDAIESRIFFLRSVHLSPLFFKSRDTFSPLTGPMSLAQIEKVSPPKSAPAPRKKEKKVIQAAGEAKIHYVHPKLKIERQEELCFVAPYDGEKILWERAREVAKEQKPQNAMPLPTSEFIQFLAEHKKLEVYKADGLISNPGETEVAFKERVKEIERGKIREKMGKLHAQLEAKKQKKTWKMVDALITFGTTVLGGFIGRRVTKGTISQAGVSMRKAGRMVKEGGALSKIEEEYQALQDQLEQVNPNIEIITLYPNKKEIAVSS